MTTIPPDFPGVRVDPSTLGWVGFVWPGCFLTFAPTGAFDVDDVIASMRAAIDSIGTADEGSPVSAPAVLDGLDVVHVRVNYGATRPPAVRRWVTLLAESMTARGLVGLLHRQLPKYPPEWVARTRNWSPAVSVLYASRRSLDPATIEQLAKAHGSALLPHHTLTTGSEFNAPVALTPDLFAALPSLMSSSLTSWSDDFRITSGINVTELDAAGWSHGDSRDEQVDRARTALLTLAPGMDHAFAEVTAGAASWNRPLRHPPGGLDGTAYIQQGPHWSQRVMDAHGLQVLTGDHLARAHDLSGWRTHKVEDRYLVEARDLDEWYAPEEPDAQVLAQARADFGTMILTQAEVDARRAAERQVQIREYQERLARGEAT